MWNTLKPALNGAAAGGARPPMPAGPAAQPPMAPAAAPLTPGASAAPQPGQMPAEFQQHVDPNNQMQATLIQRGHQLTPQESQAFAAGVNMPALNVLKKLLPELGFLWDKIIQTKGPAGGAPQPGAAAPPAPGVPLPQRLAGQRFQP